MKYQHFYRITQIKLKSRIILIDLSLLIFWENSPCFSSYTLTSEKFFHLQSSKLLIRSDKRNSRVNMNLHRQVCHFHVCISLFFAAESSFPFIILMWGKNRLKNSSPKTYYSLAKKNRKLKARRTKVSSSPSKLSIVEAKSVKFRLEFPAEKASCCQCIESVNIPDWLK